MNSEYIKAKLRDVKYCDDLSLEAADYIERLEAELKQARDDAQALRSIVHLAGLSRIGHPRNEFDDMIEKLYDKARTDGVFERYKP